MTLEEYLVRKARRFWDAGENIPVDLFSEMLAAGLDVQALEQKYFVFT